MRYSVWCASNEDINIRKLVWLSSETYSEPCQTSLMGTFAKIINSFQPSTTFAKRFTLDVWQGSKYASDNTNGLLEEFIHSKHNIYYFLSFWKYKFLSLYIVQLFSLQSTSFNIIFLYFWTHLELFFEIVVLRRQVKN